MPPPPPPVVFQARVVNALRCENRPIAPPHSVRGSAAHPLRVRLDMRGVLLHPCNVSWCAQVDNRKEAFSNLTNQQAEALAARLVPPSSHAPPSSRSTPPHSPHPLLVLAIGGRFFFLFFTLGTGPRRFLSLKLSHTRVCGPQIRTRLSTTAHFCEVVVLTIGGRLSSPPRRQSVPRRRSARSR